ADPHLGSGERRDRARVRDSRPRSDQARQLRAARHLQGQGEVIGQAVSQSELDAFRRGIAQGQRSWEGLTLPWDADLRGAQLAAFDLSRATMRGAKLDRAVLSEAKLVEANLRKASLRGAVLVRADLRGADLRGADLRDAD